MAFDICKKKYIRIADKEAENRLDSLIDFLDQNGFGFFKMSERGEGDHKYVEVIVDIKLSRNSSERKALMSIEK